MFNIGARKGKPLVKDRFMSRFDGGAPVPMRYLRLPYAGAFSPMIGHLVFPRALLLPMVRHECRHAKGTDSRMTVEKDLEKILEQERALRFAYFDAETAWRLGSLLREMALERRAGLVIDVHLHSMPVFYSALSDTTADNASWVRRKRAVTLRFFRSSYAIGLALSQQGTTIEARYGVATADYATHGGSFPILLEGTGCIGAVTVSGLPQREDHNLVVEALCRMLEKDHEALRLN